MSIEETLAEILRKLDALRFQPTQDLLLTAEQAAELLQISPRFLYQHAKELPYTVTLTNGSKKTTVRFSYSGIQKYISKKLKIQEAKSPT